MVGSRRTFLRSTLGLAAAGSVSASAPKYRMGIGTAACMQRARADRDIAPSERFTETLRFLDYCRGLGAGGIQAGLTSLEMSYCARLRDKAESYGMYVEVSARLPKDATDLDRFEQTVVAAREAGASVIRTVMLSGRRYENLRTLENWKAFARQSWKSLALAEPVLSKHRMSIAIENHKDWRIDEMLAILERIESESVGVTVDTGNNMSLLEDPLETAKAFAPYAKAVHLKDMGLESYRDGFLLAEVPFGQGCLDLKAIVDTIRAVRPAARFTLEMITRNPLQIPCLRDDYWITMGSVPGADLAASLAAVRDHGRPLPRVEHLAPEERFRIEEENNRACLDYGRAHLNL